MVARSGRPQEASALIVATFAEILEIAVATYANIERTNVKALRSTFPRYPFPLPLSPFPLAFLFGDSVELDKLAH